MPPLGRVVEPIVHVGHRRRLRLVEAEDVAGRRQVHAGAEGAAGAGDDDRADGVVLAGALEGVDQLVRHLDREGVHLVGTVQRQGEDAVFDLPEQGVVGHRRLPS